MKYLNKIELTKTLNIKDLTDPSNGIHAINLIVDDIASKLNNVEMIRRSPITNVDYNYNRLYYPTDTISRDSRYTRWINETTLLRTHTSAMVIEQLEKTIDPIDKTLLMPGLVYRRDVIDKTHVGEPHQLDIWRVVKGKVGREDLLELVGVIINTILPNVKWRYNETNHYYTKDGIEVEVYVNDNWLEILECGEISPQILDDCNLDSNVYSGLAMGIGLDRSVMLRKNIKDIRILRSDNPKISTQMRDLTPYKEISKYQPMKRDLSVCVPESWDDEIIGDIIRETDIDTSVIENIHIKNQWNYEDLDNHVIEKLGLVRGYKNVLLTIILSSLNSELSKDQCNNIYNNIYTNLNMLTNIYEI